MSMQAWTFTTRGEHSKVLKLRHDLPRPQASDLAPDEVLVKVSHCALFQPQASFIKVIPHFNDKHWIPTFEFSGTVIAGGAATGDRRGDLEGQAVFGMIGPKLYNKYNGVLAEYIVAPKAAVVRKPMHASFEETSGISGAGATAIGIAEKTGLLKVEFDGLEGEYRIVNLADGKKILVTGGSTGTGLGMLQLAKVLVGPEGRVVTTCSPRNEEAVRTHGADEVIDYTQHPDFHKYLITHHSSAPFDTIIDFAGSDPQLYRCSPAYLKPDACFVFGGNMPRTHALPDTSVFGALAWIFSLVVVVLTWQFYSMWPVVLGGVPRRSFFHSGRPDARNLSLVRQLVEDRKLKGNVDSVWEMEDAIEAFDRLEKGKICGKIVIKVGK